MSARTILLTSVAAIEAFVSINRPRNSDDHWVCPECGAENVGLYFARESICPECRMFAHPTIGLRKGVEKRLAELERESQDLHRRIWDMQDEADCVDREITRLKTLLKKKKVCDVGLEGLI